TAHRCRAPQGYQRRLGTRPNDVSAKNPGLAPIPGLACSWSCRTSAQRRGDTERMSGHTLTPEIASKFAGLALAHVTREYPHKLDHVMRGPGDVRGPRALHPVFHGSFDWHSCVHGCWLLARLLRRFPGLPEAPRIAALLDAQLA